MFKKTNLKLCTNHIKKVTSKHDTETSLVEPAQVLEVFDPDKDLLIPSTSKELKNTFFQKAKALSENDRNVNVVYQVVYPDDLNLKPATNSHKPGGRRKKTKIQVESPPPVQKTKVKVVSKTRSGREIKFPKHIEKEFKKIEINDDLPPDSMDIKILDFENRPETHEKNKPELQNKLFDEPNLLQRKRRIQAQYRCPKCKKAYLGRNKILDHLKKNPSHGPWSMHQDEEKNFEVWNYLVNVTQKCPSSERGQKFCQELSNLLHNLLLLTNALFKKLGSATNEVKVDKVLGNAIGLIPGSYYFDDNNLYKNVTVLKLMANNDFLHSVRSKTDDISFKSNVLLGPNCDCGKRSSVDELFLKSMLITSENGINVAKQTDSNKMHKNNVDAIDENGKNLHQIDEVKKFIGDINSEKKIVSVGDCEIKTSLEDDRTVNTNNNYAEQYSLSEVKNIDFINEESKSTQEQTKCSKGGFDKERNVTHQTFSGEFFSPDINLTNDFSVNVYEIKQPYNVQTKVTDHVDSGLVPQKQMPSPKIKIQSNILICPPKFFQKDTTEFKCPVSQNVNNSELMTDNTVLIPPPNITNSVDELMLSVPSEPNSVLDNSCSSDELMNVDQFVNERFRKITESDLEVVNSSSLNLELPSLDLFQFHTS